MAEEIIENEDVQEELEEEVKEEEKKEVNSSGEKEEDKEGIMKKIISAVYKKRPPEEEVSEESDEEEIEVPDAFYEATKAQGWSDDDVMDFTIGEDGKPVYTDEELKEMIPFLSVEESQSKDKTSTKESDKKTPEKKSDKEESKELKALRQELADLKETVGAVQKDKAAKEQVDLANRVDSIFDKAAEKFEVFGNTKELRKFPAGPRKGQVIPTSPAYKARMEVFEIAAPFIAAGKSVDEAMGYALDWYKGKNLEADVKRSLIKDLKGKEKKLSAKRMGKEASPKFKDKEEEKDAVVREAYRKAGVKGF